MLDWLERAVLAVGVAALALLTFAVAAQVALRYLFAVTPIWSEELSRYLLVWAVLAGAAASVRGNRHIRVEFLADLLPPALRRGWYRLLDVLALAVFVLVAVLGVEAVKFNHGMRSTGLQAPLSYVMTSVPLFFAAAAVFLAGEIWQRRGRR